MILSDAIHPYTDLHPWTAISVVLTEVQDKVSPRYLPVQRGVVVKAVVPVDREAKEALVELLRFGYIEDAEDGYDGVESEGHDG